MSDISAPLRDRPLDDASIESATAHYALPREADQTYLSSALIFRLGSEWLALSTALLDRVADLPLVHSLPHRRGGATAGLVNVGGDLVVHVSLAGLLGVESGHASLREEHGTRRSVSRLVVLADARGRLAITVDEVWGVHHYGPADLRPVPPTLARAPSSFTTAMLHVDGHLAGCLDGGRVLDALSMAIS